MSRAGWAWTGVQLRISFALMGRRPVVLQGMGPGCLRDVIRDQLRYGNQSLGSLDGGRGE